MANLHRCQKLLLLDIEDFNSIEAEICDVDALTGGIVSQIGKRLRGGIACGQRQDASAAADLPLPNPDFPLVRVWFSHRFQVHTDFRVEDQECLVVHQELDVRGGGQLPKSALRGWACIQTPPQFRIPLQACDFGFVV